MSAGEPQTTVSGGGAALAVAGVVGSAILCGLYVQGDLGWPIGFVAWVPWLWALDRLRSTRAALLAGWAMSVAFTAAVFPWFGGAIGRIAEIGTPAGLLLLLLVAPIFQPQILAFALLRHLARQRCRPALAACVGVLTWVATERLVPKLLGDTLGYGLYPSPLLRQAADLGGAAGLTLVLLLVNEALVHALKAWRDGVNARVRSWALVALGPVLLAGYGAIAMPPPPGAETPTVRMGLVQTAIVDYERLRRQRGTGEVVREILDTHYSMSYDAVERQRVQAVLWSETVYPTTFGRAKSDAGAELDREIQGIVNAAGVPFVFGTFEGTESGEYNAAAFVAPGRGLVGFYRKTRLFPLTEFVPDWLDGPAWRRLAPWSGTWRAGDGARVFPLYLADGREVPVLPLICLDAVDTGLAVAGARLGAQLILGMSNDSWFTDHPQGARLHLAVAAFRSIETRLPQFRVTSNGYSAVIDASGQILATSRMGERTLVVGELPLREPRRTLVVAWGDWVGLAAAAALTLLGATSLLRRVRARGETQRGAKLLAPAIPERSLPYTVSLLSPALRIVVAGLRVISRGSLLVMAAMFLFGDGLAAGNTLAQIRLFALIFIAPELTAYLLLRAFAAQATQVDGRLVLVRGAWRIELAWSDVAAVEGWRWPIPVSGAWLRLRSGGRWPHGLAGVDAVELKRALLGADAGPPLVMPAWSQRYAEVRSSMPPGRLGHPWSRFVLLPLLLAIPAFRLHQNIAYGSSFGEWQSFGPVAFLKGFAIWWAAWAIAIVVIAALIRATIEALTLAAVWLRPDYAAPVRRALERSGLVLLYLGPPLWLALRVLGG